MLYGAGEGTQAVVELSSATAAPRPAAGASPASALEAQGPLAAGPDGAAGGCTAALRTRGCGAGAMTACLDAAAARSCPLSGPQKAEPACWTADPCAAGRVRGLRRRAATPLPFRPRMERKAKADRVRSRARSRASSTAGSRAGGGRGARPAAMPSGWPAGADGKVCVGFDGAELGDSRSARRFSTWALICACHTQPIPSVACCWQSCTKPQYSSVLDDHWPLFCITVNRSAAAHQQ